MMKKTVFLVLLACLAWQARAMEPEQVKPVKNLIVLIPDGTSLATISTARWYQWYMNPDMPKLAIDPYICGTVRTHSSNAPIGDSAPTTSCYMTGHPSRTGYVATYPPHDPGNDIYPMDPKRAYQPMTTLLEAMKLVQHKATGLVFTCEFTHATPADCSAHSYSRKRYEWIAPQMVHNDIDVVIGGGTSLLDEAGEAYLKANGYNVYRNDMAGMRSDNSNKMWALFGDRDMAYDIDRDPAQQPSIEEMTKKALDKLSKNENGFFLMVEGSKVDWAAHGNDPVGMLTDYLAFDKACRVAFDFARRDGHTLVVMVSDHGNSGFSLGRRDCKGYDKLTKDQLFGTVTQIKLSADGFAKKLNEQPSSAVQEIFRQYAGFELTDEELQSLYHCKGYKNSPIPENERSEKEVLASLYSSSLNGFIAKLITSKTCFGFTTNGHTGEDVLLAAYHPAGTLPMGMHTNIELNHYMTAAVGLTGKLDELTDANFAPHTEVLKGYTYSILLPATEKENPTLVVKNKKKQLTITPYTNIVKLGKKGKEEMRLQTVIVYVDKNETFYLPRTITDYLK